MKKQVRVNLSMDKEVIEKAKELGINPSKFCENALGKNLSNFCENALKEAIEKMQNQKPWQKAERLAKKQKGRVLNGI